MRPVQGQGEGLCGSHAEQTAQKFGPDLAQACHATSAETGGGVGRALVSTYVGSSNERLLLFRTRPHRAAPRVPNGTASGTRVPGARRSPRLLSPAASLHRSPCQLTSLFLRPTRPPVRGQWLFVGEVRGTASSHAWRRPVRGRRWCCLPACCMASCMCVACAA